MESRHERESACRRVGAPGVRRGGLPSDRAGPAAARTVLRGAATLSLALTAFSGGAPRSGLPGAAAARPATGASPDAAATGRTAPIHTFAPVERGRDPLGLVRTAVRPRIWILFDTSTSMNDEMVGGRKIELARETVAHAVRHLVSDTGEPLVHWRLAVFGPYRWNYELDEPRVLSCNDPTMGKGLPAGSPEGLPLWTRGPCPGMEILSAVAGCDAETARREVLAALPRDARTEITPNGIALHQLAGYIRNTAIADLRPGQQNIILLVTDGVDTCECDFHAWPDPDEGRKRKSSSIFLRARETDSTPLYRRSDRFRFGFGGMNAGLKAKAAFLALNDGDPDAGIGDIHVVGFTSGRRQYREITNHLGWMASNLRRPAYHAKRADALAEAIGDVLRTVTLPEGVVKLGAPVLAGVKELVAGSPSAAFRGTDPSLAAEALVADPADTRRFEETLRRRHGYADNVLLSTSAELSRLRGNLRAHPVFGGGTGAPAADRTGPPVIWDAGARLARRDPDDRLILYNRPGETTLRRFEVGAVKAWELGVYSGFLRELDGRGARSGEDAAELVVRIIRGETIAVHPDTGTIYDEAGELHFTGGVGSWKLRESLAAPAVASNPPRHPEAVARHRAEYRSFFEARVNRRTVVYLPTNGGLLHAFAADTGDELFAYIPDDLLGPHLGETWQGINGRTLLHDLAAEYALLTPERRIGMVARYTLAGAPVVRDLYLPEAGRWATVLAFGREYGSRFLTALDISEVGGEWDGTHAPERPGAGGRGLPRLLFNLGNLASKADGDLDGLGETPAPLLAETPGAGGRSSEWTAFLSGGLGSPTDDSGEWLFEISPETGRVRQRYRLARGTAPRIEKNGAPTAPAPWSPAWAQPGASDLVTRLYLGDLHGQVHRLALDAAGARRLEVAFRLGGEHPIVSRPVAFPFPGRSEPHLLVVSGGDRRVAGERALLLLLRETGGRLREVWRRPLPVGESPQGNPAVRIGSGTVEVLLVTKSADREQAGCGETVITGGVSRLRAFNGLTGAPAAGALGVSGASVAYGPSRVRGLSVSSAGNLALGVSQAGGAVFDAVIGDFRFKVREGALAEISLFVEGLRRSPF